MNPPTSPRRQKPQPLELFGYRHVHFVGVGGAGMSSLALALARKGASVSGSDVKPSRYTDHLMAAGVRVSLGHAPANLNGAELVVVSTAIAAENSELAEARRRGLPVWRRSEALAALLDPCYSVCCCGSHGKSSTTAMLGLAMASCGLDPTVYVGGEVEAFGGNFRLGESDFAIAEADESDGSFLHLPVDYVVLTNIDAEHLDYWGDGENLRQGFRSFIESGRQGGRALIARDDRGARRLLDEIEVPLATYSLERPAADFAARRVRLLPFGSRFEFLQRGHPLGEVELSVPGVHNVANATAAIGATLELGGDFERAVAGLRDFRGVRRRFQVVGEAAGALIVDDYAHHPTEIASTLRAARDAADARRGRLIAVFQPHRFTRTRSLCEDFGPAFLAADLVILTEIYSAGEPPIPGVSSARILEAIHRAQGPQALLAANLAEIPAFLCPRLRSGDVVITMGAGDITILGPALLTFLRPDSLSSHPAAYSTAREVFPC